MHAAALKNGERFFDSYVTSAGKVTVVDIGAQDINGSLKQVCPSNAKYIGVDFVAGLGVDVVLTDPFKLPFANESIDFVVSSSCFEHAEMFWLYFLEALRVLKPHGIFYLNGPANGPFHRYPVDCWRFYPDSGNALAKWGRINGFNTTLLESYTSNQFIEPWNDYVCVFIKDENEATKYPRKILDSLSDFSNGFRYPYLNTILNETSATQDQSLLGWRIHKKILTILSRFSSS